MEPKPVVLMDDTAIVLDLDLSRMLADGNTMPGSTLPTGEFVTDIANKGVFDTLLQSQKISGFITYADSYKPNGKYSIREHQKLIVDFYLMYTRGYNYADMGVGKTASTLWAFDILRKRGRCDRLIVSAPSSTLLTAWLDDATNATPDLRVAVLTGSKAKRVKVLVDDRHDVYVINHDGVKTVYDALLDLTTRHKNRVMFVCDEATAISQHNNARAEAHRSVMYKCRRVYVLTATPVVQSLSKALGLMLAINNNTSIPRTITDFNNRFMVKDGYKMVPRYSAPGEVQRLMSPAIYMATRDVVSLPERIYLWRAPPLTQEQDAAWRQMEEEYRYEHANGVAVDAVNAGVKLGKLFQIACGILMTGGDGVLALPPAGKYADLVSIIEQSQSKVVIFAPFRAAVEWIAAKLTDDFGEGSTCKMYGGMSVQKKGDVIREFQDPESKLKYLVAQPESASHGVTLTEADTTVWFGPIMKKENFVQANRRVDRPGQTRNNRIIFLASTDLERTWYDELLAGDEKNIDFVQVYNAFLSTTMKKRNS